MPHPHDPGQGQHLTAWSRRMVLGAVCAAGAATIASPDTLAATGDVSLRFGLTPVFLDSDTDLLAALERYLSGRLERSIVLVKRRTYQEITTLLMTGQLDAAWICGFPYVQFRSQLALVAVPLYRDQPFYQSYVIVHESDPSTGLDDLRGQVHAFSDPDSNSGFLVTRYLLATMKETPASFFRRSFFTYSHRNVVRAVASGLAQGGSVDGYVWDVIAEVEPDLVAHTRVLHRSELLGFPPIACQSARLGTSLVRSLREALVGMRDDPTGREVLHLLRLDGFAVAETSLFDGIAAMYDFVKGPVMKWIVQSGSWPLTVKVPLLVAVLMAAVGAVISYSVLMRLADDQETQLRQLSVAHLETLAVALEPHLARQDVWETFDVLDHARRAATAASIRLLVVTLPDATVVAASDPMMLPVGTPLPGKLRGHLHSPGDMSVDKARGLAWSHRPIGTDGAPLGHILAELDMAPLVAVRREVLATLVAVNGGVTLLFAAVGYVLVGQLLRPIRVLDDYVDRIRSGAVEAIPTRFITEEGSEFGRLFRRFNAMAQAVAERESLSVRLADEEKLALLGRLASGMAHEVNNPLGGMMTAVDTIKHHGRDDAVRLRSAALLERGLRGIGDVVRAALVAYKEPSSVGAMTPEDLDDLRFLVAHEAQRRHVDLVWRNRLENTLALDGAAIRQMALNLLLNACRAAPPGSEVTMMADASDDGLSVTIRDQGSGMPEEMAALLRSREARRFPLGGRGLGLWTVARLLERTGGDVEVAVTTVGAGGGTAVTVFIPFLDGRRRNAAA